MGRKFRIIKKTQQQQHIRWKCFCKPFYPSISYNCILEIMIK